MTHLETVWRTDDPTVAAALAQITAMPPGTPERHEALAGLHVLQARWEWREADRLARNDRYRRTPRVVGPEDGRRQVTKAACPSCGAQVRVRLDGTLRAHVTGTAGGWQSTHGRDGPRCPGSGHPPAA